MYLVQIKSNNQDILVLVKNLYLYKQSKYIDIQYYYIQNLEVYKQIIVSYILTTSIVADRITKLLDKIAFQKFKNLISIVTNTEQENRKSF